MEHISKNGVVLKNVEGIEGGNEAENNTVPISEPIPMTAAVQEETA